MVRCLSQPTLGLSWARRGARLVSSPLPCRPDVQSSGILLGRSTHPPTPARLRQAQLRFNFRIARHPPHPVEIPIPYIRPGYTYGCSTTRSSTFSLFQQETATGNAVYYRPPSPGRWQGPQAGRQAGTRLSRKTPDATASCSVACGRYYRRPVYVLAKLSTDRGENKKKNENHRQTGRGAVGRWATRAR
jgi:hypothetical protein